MVLTAIPASLILRLFLTPDRSSQITVRSDGSPQRIAGKRVHLFHTHDRQVRNLMLVAQLEQVVEHLTGTQYQALHCRRVDLLALPDNRLELPLRQLFELRNGLAVTKQTLR